MAQDFEFRSFLLQLSKDMSSTDFEQLKYLLKGYVSSAKCEEITEVCKYFGELERMCLLTPTNFGVLKKALGAIGRQDLVEKIEQKEQHFADLFRESNGNNLPPKEYDAVCDVITKAAGRLEALARSGHNTPELKKKLLLTSAENEDEIQVQELYDVLSVSDTPTDVVELEKEKKIKKADDLPSKEEKPPKQLPHVIGMQTGGEAQVKPSPQMDKDENMELPLENDVELNSSEDAMAAEDHLLEPTTTEHELASEEKTTVSKTDQKEPSEDTVTDCNELEGLNAGKTPVTHNTAEATTWATGLPATTQPSISCHMELDDDVVTDGNEDDKKDVASKKDGEEKSTSKGADYQGPQHVHGAGARPKELHVHVPLKKAKTTGPSEATEQKATQQADEVAGTNPHGTLFAEFNSGDWDANSKEPTEGAYSGPPTPTGNISESTIPDENDSEMYSDASPAENISLIPDKGDCGLYSDEEESTGSLQEEPKLTSHGPGKGASTASKGPNVCYHPPGIFSTPPSDHGESAYSDAPATGGLPLSETELFQIASALGLNSSALQQPGYDQQMALMNQLLALQQSVSGAQGFTTSQVPNSYSSASSSASTADSPLQSNCYNKAGYAVVISNGYLCESTSDKGVVMMESGTQFCIVIANDNNYAAEVDITFGGMYLGVWTVEAKQSLSSPLVIEGSSWAPGRLRFFSAADGRKPQPCADIYGETPALNGIIELEFKPEVKVMTLFAQHARAQGEEKDLHKISLTDFETATVGDLKRVISKKWKTGISYLMKGGEVLQEEKTISSYALNEKEIIQVLNAEEELKIESVGRDPVTMRVDPRNVSVEAVKYFIANEIKIQVDEQLLRFKGQDVHVDVDSKSLTRMLIKSKQVPVLKVVTDTTINVKVLLPNGNEEKVEIKWFATVDDLKKKLEERNICDTNATLKFKDQEIGGQGSKKLYDLGFKNKSEIQVVTVSQPKRGTYRGFGGINFDSPRTSQTRGFGVMRGFDDHISTAAYRGSPSGTRTLRGDPEDVEHDSIGDHGEEGVAMLYGTEENVFKHFQVDNLTLQFSKEKAVLLIIQLIAKSMGAAAPSPPSMPSGGTTGPRSTPYPPPVPE